MCKLINKEITNAFLFYHSKRYIIIWGGRSGVAELLKKGQQICANSQNQLVRPNYLFIYIFLSFM